MPAPVASGWSDFAGWGLHPLEKRRLVTAHTAPMVAAGALDPVLAPFSAKRFDVPAAA